MERSRGPLSVASPLVDISRRRRTIGPSPPDFRRRAGVVMHRFPGLVALAVFFPPALAAADPKVPPTPPEGVLPAGANGKPLNLDFETGTLKDWRAEGKAFAGQPV